MATSQKQEFMLSLNGGNGDRFDEDPHYRSPHRKRVDPAWGLPPSSADLMRERGPGTKRTVPGDASGRFTGGR